VVTHHLGIMPAMGQQQQQQQQQQQLAHPLALLSRLGLGPGQRMADTGEAAHLGHLPGDLQLQQGQQQEQQV
jgi:hypothetical protein